MTVPIRFGTGVRTDELAAWVADGGDVYGPEIRVVVVANAGRAAELTAAARILNPRVRAWQVVPAVDVAQLRWRTLGRPGRLAVIVDDIGQVLAQLLGGVTPVAVTAPTTSFRFEDRA